ncbi:hypothetical protein PTTG_26120 [Puccinia triticina 1-1 BBBD Race 1]|uniref:U1-type domain-containing protein n=1 Tax=Puccinia triticina (isolate 1-1 / race 1 (BBBD)) TaxID=630390 RepID=A0A180GWV7_PUCT1|nr:hypothetical protein PTTG_26120 [Puccinia triticina 1-1 BBBD Race 1]
MSGLDYELTGGVYHCNLCPRATGAKNWRRHCQSKTHQDNIKKRDDLQIANRTKAEPLPGPMPQIDLPQTDHAEDDAHEMHFWERLERLQVLDAALTSGEDDSRRLADHVEHVEARGLQEDPSSAIPASQPPDWIRLKNTEVAAIRANKDNEPPEEPGAESSTAKTRPILRTDTRSDRVNTSEWYPFRNKEDLIASLIIGHSHSMVSRTLYDKIKGILRLCNIKLPDWGTVRLSRARIRDLLGSKLQSLVSVFDVPCYSLSSKKILSQDLANPQVSKHLDYYPEWTNGLMISKFSQSGKWLTGLSRAQRPQMCDVKGKHFYIYEPVQLISRAVVIPIFLFNYQSELHAKCWEVHDDQVSNITSTIDGKTSTHLKIKLPMHLEFHDPRLSSVATKNFNIDYSHIRWEDGRYLDEACAGKLYGKLPKFLYEIIVFPNPWREKSGNKIIRNVPITLYADDTSGNVSKQWNKHISFYFTLSGLPPQISNQKYNCHFLATSNLASVCEMSQHIVKELNDMTTVGFEAYNHSISQPVWVTSSVFCFLGDSPMHAEITSTPNPGSALNPCRMCSLSVRMKKFRRTKTYIRHFCLRDEFGSERPRKARKWLQTKKRCHMLYDIATGKSFNKFINKEKQFGLKDKITTRFLIDSRKNETLKAKMESLALNESMRHQLCSPFLELIDTNKEQLIGRLASFTRTSLNIESFKPRQSLLFLTV